MKSVGTKKITAGRRIYGINDVNKNQQLTTNLFFLFFYAKTYNLNNFKELGLYIYPEGWLIGPFITLVPKVY